MKLTTWNVNGLRAREQQVLDWLEHEEPDILCLQEIKASLSQLPPALRDHPGYHSYWHGSDGGYSGVSLHVRKTFCPKRPVFTHPEFDHESRIVVATFDDVDVASIYLPNGGKDLLAKFRFLEALEAWVSAAHKRSRKLVLSGDLNVALTPRDVHPKLANPNQIGQTERERRILSSLMEHGLSDLLRNFNPDDDSLFTWWAPWRNHRERNIGWRLDYVLSSPALTPKATSCKCDREFGSSDHGPVTAVFQGALFDVAKVIEGTNQVFPGPDNAAAPASPQLDLFN